MKKTIEQIIKKTFCKLKTVQNCNYYKKSWCPKTCNFGFYNLKFEEYRDISLQKIEDELQKGQKGEKYNGKIH